ncbi:MAG: NAD-dependent epimerase/dehydratase family protein, partial [Acidimicrobiales bacterium]|nr:NAD-dependent epimerase/dehydratase family protein [Acidimicrobiales bacterium]
LVDRLMAEGAQVDVIDDLTTGNLANLSIARSEGAGRFHFHSFDIRDESSISVIERVKPDVIFHLAAQADVRVSVKDPVFDASVNIIGTLNILEGARKAQVKKVVFAASGGTLYGDPPPDHLPINESEPQLPLCPYGVSKKSAIDYLLMYRELYGIEFSALALSNVYGPRQNPHGEAGVVAIFASNVLNGVESTIFGDGGQTRDFVFVDDVVDAFYRASLRGGGVVINIGTGKETSVMELLETISDAAGKSPSFKLAPERQGELRRNSLDPARAEMLLGWKPWTSLGEGIGATLKSMAGKK